MDSFFDYFGFTGGILLLAAFFLNAKNKLPSDGFWYSCINFLGSAILGIAAFEAETWAALTLELFWAGFALFTLLNKYLGVPQRALYLQALPLLGLSLAILIAKGGEGTGVLAWHNIVGYAGNLILLAMYFLNLERRIDPEKNPYLLFNMIGAVALVIPAVITQAYSIVFIAGAWTILAIISIITNIVNHQKNIRTC